MVIWISAFFLIILRASTITGTVAASRQHIFLKIPNDRSLYLLNVCYYWATMPQADRIPMSISRQCFTNMSSLFLFIVLSVWEGKSQGMAVFAFRHKVRVVFIPLFGSFNFIVCVNLPVQISTHSTSGFIFHSCLDLISCNQVSSREFRFLHCRTRQFTIFAS